MLLVLVAVLAAKWSGALGLGVLALAAWSALLKPAWACLHWVAKSGELSGRRPRAVLALLLIVSVIGVLGVGVPLPQRRQQLLRRGKEHSRIGLPPGMFAAVSRDRRLRVPWAVVNAGERDFRIVEALE